MTTAQPRPTLTGPPPPIAHAPTLPRRADRHPPPPVVSPIGRMPYRSIGPPPSSILLSTRCPRADPPSFSLLCVGTLGHPIPPLPHSPPLQKDVARRRRALVLFPSSILPLKHPTGKTPLPVAFLTAPTIGALPLTKNSVAPPTSSPLRGESRHRAPSSPFLPFELGPYLFLTLAEPRECLGAMPTTVWAFPADALNSLRHPTVVPPPRGARALVSLLGTSTAQRR
jgi:hypothetical protein